MSDRLRETKLLADRINNLSGLDEMNKSIMADANKPRSRPKGSRFGMFVVVNSELMQRSRSFETKQGANAELARLNRKLPQFAKSRKIVRLLF